VPLALDEDLQALSDTVAKLAARHGSMVDTRERLAEWADGALPAAWGQLVAHGLHALHLPEPYGAGAGLPELVVVAEQLGRALVPGPWLPTVLASAVAATSPAAGNDLLQRFADGATGALVLSGLTAERGDDGTWRVSGTSASALGLTGADLVVVRARAADGPVWFTLVPDAGQVRPADAVDLTRSVGRLVLDAHAVAPDAVLTDLEEDQADLAVAALLAAEAAGIAQWALECAVEHVRTRVQFDRPVGSFQAVQHKAAMMLVRAEVAVAAAWDAARAEHQPADQRRLAAAQATVTALPAAVDCALECVTLLGGIGFTWEHDAHLYWRRATSISGVAGTEHAWARRLGEAALVATREPDALPELRARVGAVLDRVLALPPDSDGPSGPWGPVGPGARRSLLADAGLVAPHYEQPWGLAAGPREQAVIVEEFERRGLVPPTTVIGEWVLPTLLQHGTGEQVERFVGPTLRGEVVWCQLFSEPGAGSDLASLSTRATRVDGGWLLRGQKVWTSMAHEADWGVCLARTDPDAAKHRGISYFLVDMRSPGVDVRPLRQATGRAEFNEVFLDDVLVPDSCLVGECDDGWRLAATTLSNERVSMGSRLSHGSSARVRDLCEAAEDEDRRRDALTALGRCTAREIALGALNQRGVLTRMQGQDGHATTSVQKVFNALAQREGSREVVALLGPGSSTTDGGHVVDHIGLPAVLFGGGTIEIQLNVIARRVLGLPR
jgi:alkylation response protein AidB-like acyl-CoA dehydrogenase